MSAALDAGASAGAGAGAGAASSDKRTPAQRAFDEQSAKRLRERARVIAASSYREQITKLNKDLEKLPAHNDLFKIQ